MTIQNTMKLMPKAWVHPQVFHGVHRQLWSGESHIHDLKPEFRGISN